MTKFGAWGFGQAGGLPGPAGVSIRLAPFRWRVQLLDTLTEQEVVC